jgi:hypothetical protein
MDTVIDRVTAPGPLHPIPWDHPVAPDHSGWTATRPGTHVRDLRVVGGGTSRQTAPGPVGSCAGTARCPQCRLAAAVRQQQAETADGVTSRCAIAAYIPTDPGAPIPIVVAASNTGGVELAVLELMRHERGRLGARLADLVATHPADAVVVAVYTASGAGVAEGEAAHAVAEAAMRDHRCGCGAPAEHLRIKRRGGGRLHRAAMLTTRRTVRPRLVAAVAAAAELSVNGPMSGEALTRRPYAAAAALALADLETPWNHHGHHLAG